MSDATYMEAVKRVDMKTAQRMVDAAAEAAGYDLGKLYHGNETGPLKSINRPLFLSASKNEAKAYSEVTDTEAFTNLTLVPMERSKVRFPSKMDRMRDWPIADDFVGEPFTPQATADGELFYWDGETNAYGDNNLVFISNRIADNSGAVVKGKPDVEETSPPRITPFVGSYYVGGKLLPVKDSRFAEPGQPSAVNVIASRLGGDLRLVEKWKVLLRQRGYSGIDTFSDDGLQRGLRVRNVVMFDPTQIKSADPVTYDDMDNVIPLSRRFNSQSEEIRNPRQLMGININDKCQDFTGQILRGEKTIETRKTRSLDPYIGERVGLVRTGVGKATLVGYATVGKPVVYDSVSKFRRDYDKHLVAPGSAFDIKDGLKYGYPLMQVESITPKLVQSKGIVARKLNPASRTVDEAAKKAGYTTKAFHRTSSKFTKFIPGGPNATRQIWRTKSGESRTLFGQSGRAMWFGTSPDNLPAYHNEPTGKGVVLTVYLKNPNPLQIDDDTRDWARDVYADGSKEFPLLLSDEHIRNIRGDGYTGIEYWQKGKTAEKSSPDEIVVFDANQIKSADLVTYDDAGNSIPISNRFSGKSDDIRNPVTPSIRKKLASVIEFDDRILCYDTAADEDFYRLWDIIHTDLTLNKESLREIEGMLDDDGVLVIESGETPAGLQDHFRKTTRYQGLLLVQGPLNPEQARIETEKLRRDLE